MSVATENFLKAIYLLEKNKLAEPKPGNVAKALGISNAAATDMAKNLSKKDLIVYHKYKPLLLTEKGKKQALNVLRKHRLWEALLFQLFDMSLHEIHIEAEKLEHQTSDFLANQIEAYLGSPKYDPHGDPIPNANGKIEDVNYLLLSEAEPNSEYKVVRLMSSEKSFFDFCELYNLNKGQKIRVKSVFDATGFVEVITDKGQLVLNHDFSQSIGIVEAVQNIESKEIKIV